MIAPARLKADHPSLEYVLPFVLFLAFLAVDRMLPVSPLILYPLRLVVVSASLVVFSRRAISFRTVHFGQSVLMGIAVWVIWVGPDVLWPGYRSLWLFENSLTGPAKSSLPPALRANWLFLAVRSAGSVLVVPVIEELFWRSWMMRWLIDRDFWKLPLGAYAANAFWTVAILFGCEHGPYWEVGLAAGILYNWWMVRTKSLGDCILAHAVTNACLAAHVIAAGQWQYWL